MDEITKDHSEEDKSQMPVVREPGSMEAVPAKSNVLAVYEKQEVTSEKKGLFGKPSRKSILSRGQLVQLLQENIETFPDHERQFLRAIFDLNTLTAQEMMVPLSEIVPLTIDAPCAEILKYCRVSNNRYIPVYNERVDQLIGTVDAMEVATSEQYDQDLTFFVREVNYIPALKPALDLLNELRQSEIPVAIVVNEHGSCIGIVELIDILEQVIGEIATNQKREIPRMDQFGQSEWRIDARVLISEVNTALDIDLPTDRCDTIGGFILMLTGRLPQTGEKIEYEDLEFNVSKVFKYRISEIRVLKKTDTQTQQ